MLFFRRWGAAPFPLLLPFRSAAPFPSPWMALLAKTKKWLLLFPAAPAIAGGFSKISRFSPPRRDPVVSPVRRLTNSPPFAPACRRRNSFSPTPLLSRNCFFQTERSRHQILMISPFSPPPNPLFLSRQGIMRFFRVSARFNRAGIFPSFFPFFFLSCSR